MRAAITLVLVFALAGIAAGGAMSEGTNSVGSELAAKLIEAWNSDDAALIESIFADDCVYEDTNGLEYHGTDGAKDYIDHIHRWASDVVVETKSTIALGDAAVVEWQFRGVQVAPVGFIEAATGREFSIRGATIVESSGGLITRASDYVDIATFLVQLGVECSVRDSE